MKRLTMKKIISLIITAVLLMSFASCSLLKEVDVAVDPTDAKQVLPGKSMAEVSDSTNTYKFNADGTYEEMYKGGLLTGTWEATDKTVTLTFSGSENVKYVFDIDRDADGNVTGISQYAGRQFTFTD